MGEIHAVLGPTNTGKTHRAIERMLEFETGMLGFPLRLLAREVYERVRATAGADAVALVTGEEKIVPRTARYFVCTVEAMPMSRPVEFLAVDEIQLASHEQRGHLFTERLLDARGEKETWFLGSDSMRPVLRDLVPTAQVSTFTRLSRLSYAGAHNLPKVPPRSAIVAFSLPEVYALAERVRSRRGGAAVVAG
ncbi:MAG: helicase, partial [Proteobacteria bacterium]